MTDEQRQSLPEMMQTDRSRIMHILVQSQQPTESTFVFRSYANPDNTTTATKLKAVFYNKVKTGTLKIIKTAAYGEQLSGEYKFRVTFTNVGDLGLEENPITQEYTIKLNGDGQPGSCEITGIPVGTFFKVEEISTDDGSTLDSIVIDRIEQPKGTTAAKGYIKSSGTTVETTFRNTIETSCKHFCREALEGCRRK